jgi:hypothetical protein
MVAFYRGGNGRLIVKESIRRDFVEEIGLNFELDRWAAAGHRGYICNPATGEVRELKK